MRPTPFICKHSSRTAIAGSFVCAKIRNNDVCNVGKSKSLGGCGTPATAGLPESRAQVFRQTALRDRSLSCTKLDFVEKSEILACARRP